MEELRDQVGETVFLGMRARGGRVRSGAKVPSRQAIRYDALLDVSDPAFSTAMGRVLLAHWDPRALDRHLGQERPVRYTDRTVIDRAEIRRLLVQIREQGYALCDEEFEAGGSGVAAPVQGRDGMVFAALNVATPSARFPAKRATVIDAVRGYAAMLSRRSGHYGGAGGGGAPRPGI